MDPSNFIAVVGVLSGLLLIWSCIEVGANDATNLVNAVFGARILQRKLAVLIAGIFVVAGATTAGPVLETVTSSIFANRSWDNLESSAIFLATYLVNTVMLFSYSAYGLPISSTAIVIFALTGGALGVSYDLNSVSWSIVGNIIVAIFCSIGLSGFLSYWIQKIFRAVIGTKVSNHNRVYLHGPWISGIIVTGLIWFLIFEGMSGVTGVKDFNNYITEIVDMRLFLLLSWLTITIITFLVLSFLGKLGTRNLFRVLAIFGMCCMAFAFGQNDLANCAAPGLSTYDIWQGSNYKFSPWALFLCGLFMYIGMGTKRAHRVTRAEVNTASQYSKVQLYAPNWCIALAAVIQKCISLNAQDKAQALTFKKRSSSGKKLHYDALRAAVILAVSAAVIAFSSSLGLPVSTTYVTFAAVVATGYADKAFTTDSAQLKLGRAVFVVFSWLVSALLAAVMGALFTWIIVQGRYWGILGCFCCNFFVYRYFSSSASLHESKYHGYKKKKL